MFTFNNFRGGVVRPRAFSDDTAPSAFETALVALARLAERLGRAAARRRTIRLLHALDDRTLNDIGVKRGDIDTIVLDPSRWRRR